MKKSFGVVHVLAECRTLGCGWTCQNHKNGQALAAKHASHYGHIVAVEVGISGTYDGTGVGNKRGAK